MRVIRKEQILKETIEITCDFCNSQTYIHSCDICNKDCCNKCGEIHPEDFIGNDYPRWLCHRCYHIGQPFLEDIRLLEENLEKNKELLIDKWRESAMIQG